MKTTTMREAVLGRHDVARRRAHGAAPVTVAAIARRLFATGGSEGTMSDRNSKDKKGDDLFAISVWVLDPFDAVGMLGMMAQWVQ